MKTELGHANGTAPAIDHDRLRSDIMVQLRRSLAAPSHGEWLWIGSLAAVMLAGVFAYTWQCMNGLKVTGMREYIFWGVYMTNFVFFIGVSHAGTLISAILRVTGAEWRRSITRMAEAITVFALAVGAPMVIIDMGRPDRILNVVLHGRINSPILWDVCSIATYMSGSLLYLYVAMIPDFALLAPRRAMWERLTLRERVFRFLSLGFEDTPEQRKLLEKALATMAVIIIPVAISVHTVVSWIFGMTLRPGWHSTIFGPYFVIGAIFSGTAGIITAMVVFRKVYHLENFLTERQFQNLGRLLIALNLLYIYFTLAEYLTAWYGSEEADHRLIDTLMGKGPYGTSFWAWAVFGLFLPAIMMLVPHRRSLIPRLLIASILINIGMWAKRYLIIVPTLMTPYIPPEAAGVTPSYLPTWVEWTVTLGGFATFLMLFTVFAKVFPIISIWETVEGVTELGAKNIGVDLELPTMTARPPWPRPPIRPRRFVPAPAAVVGIVVLFVALGIVAAAGAEPSQPGSPLQLVIGSRAGDDGPQLTALVRRDGQPVADVPVEFLVRRALGQLRLGTQPTGSNGIAAIDLPTTLPGGPQGELAIVTQIKTGKEVTATAEASVPGGASKAARNESFPRALWSPRAPVALVATIVLLLSIVWSTYSFVIVQLIKIRKTSKP